MAWGSGDDVGFGRAGGRSGDGREERGADGRLPERHCAGVESHHAAVFAGVDEASERAATPAKRPWQH
eukprot:2156472-Rhodomonas_salina.3